MSETTVGREPLQIVEIEQGPDEYTGTSLTLRFGHPQASNPRDVYIIPSLRSVSTAPTKINPGGGNENASPLGTRAVCTVTFQDHPHNDHLVDPLVHTRSYDPMERGTFWSKWLARNPYHQNTTLRVKDGYVGQALASMRTREYLIQRIDGPDANGRVTIKAKDVLKLAEDKRAQAPQATPGELKSALNSSATSFVVDGVAAGDYESAGTVRIGDEVITYTSASLSGDELTISGATRGAENTEADSHDAGDRVQRCLRFTDAFCWDVVYTLLTEYGNVPAAYINKSDWDAEGADWLQGFTISSIITEPTGVTDLIGEITQQCLFYVWWDDLQQLIRLQALKPPVDQPKILNDDNHILADSSRLKRDPDQRITQAWVFWGQRNPTEDLDDENNYRRVRIRIAEDEEATDKYGEKRIRKIFSRWLINEGQALTVSARMLARYRETPRFLSLRLDAKDRDLWTADVADVTTRTVVDMTGSPTETRWQVLSAEEVQPGEVVAYDLQTYEFIGRYCFITLDSAPDYDDATEAQRSSLGWICQNDGTMPNGDEGYKII